MYIFCKQGYFYFFLPCLYLFYSFSSPVALAKSLSIVLNKNGDNGCLYLIPAISGDAFSLPIFVDCRFTIYNFHYVKAYSLCYWLFRDSIQSNKGLKRSFLHLLRWSCDSVFESTNVI